MGICSSKKNAELIVEQPDEQPGQPAHTPKSPSDVAAKAAPAQQPVARPSLHAAEEPSKSVRMSRKQSITEVLTLEHTSKDQTTLLDTYDISDSVVLGEGMSGKVMTCRQRYTGDLFALKTLSVEKLRVNMDELRQEISIMKRLDHPNIVKVYETYEEATAFHVVMELCVGGQLVSRLKQAKHGFGENMVAKLMTKMIGAILYCHEQGVCHRDVKLDNFVYESDAEEAELKLIDFGLSHVLVHDGERMRDRVGTLTYMAPEVLNGSRSSSGGGYTTACDMWSLGVVAYMLLSGRRPFHHQDREEKKRLVREGRVSFEHEAWRSVSPAAQDFVMALLQKDPRLRATARRALADPWMQQANAIELRSSADAARSLQQNSLVLRSLQDFASMEALHKVALEVVAFTAPPSSFDELRKLFKTIDVDNSGTITFDEFQNAMSQYPEIPEPQVRRLFDSVDLTHNGQIDYNSFLAATLTAQQTIGEPTLRTAFSVLDRDCDGIITKDDLMATVGQACSEAEIDEMLNQIDADHTRIFYADFQRLMTEPSRYKQVGKYLNAPPRMKIEKALSMDNIKLDMTTTPVDSPMKKAPPVRRLSTEPSRLTADAQAMMSTLAKSS